MREGWVGGGVGGGREGETRAHVRGDVDEARGDAVVHIPDGSLTGDRAVT